MLKNKKIISAFGILNRTFLKYTTRILENEEITYSDSIFLVNIGEHEGVTQEEISSILAIDKSAIARSVKNMQKKGLVNTRPSEADKRAKLLFLTAAGWQKYEYIVQMNQKWTELLFLDIPREEIETFERVSELLSERAKKLRY